LFGALGTAKGYIGCHKQTVGDGEKLLTHLNSALNGLLGLDIFPRVPKKS
jgi:hypothetical protein